MGVLKRGIERYAIVYVETRLEDRVQQGSGKQNSLLSWKAYRLWSKTVAG